MTVPAAQEAQTQARQARQPQVPAHPVTDTALTAAAAAALAAAGTTALAGTPVAVYKAIMPALKAAGIGRSAALHAVMVIVQWPPDRMEGTGPAQRWTVRANLLRRAQFLISAARRIQQAIVAARSQGQPVKAAIADAVTAERRFLAQHVAASARRMRAATAVDGLAAIHGGTLGWNTVKDKRTTPECLAAAGSNFKATRPPVLADGTVAYPGAAHGSTCRCYPGPPRHGAPLLPSS
jgi:uncharacterized protein with gpF-like domain